MAGYNRIRLDITPQGGATVSVTDFAKWESAVFVFTESQDDLSYIVEIRDIILLKPAADIFINPTTLRYNVFLQIQTNDPNVPFLDFTGIVTLDDVQFVEDDLCKITIRLDNLDLLIANVASKLIQPHDTTVVLREPQRDASFVGFIATALMISYMIINTSYQVYQNYAIATGLLGTGIGGPVTSPVYLAVSTMLLVLTITLLVVSLVRVLRDLRDWINNTRVDANAYNIRQSVIDACNAAGYTVDLNSIEALRNVWLVTPPHQVKGGNSQTGYEIITAKEVFDIAKVTLNARVWVYNNVVSFVPARPVSTFPPTHPYRRSFVRQRSYDTSETANIFILGLTRDPSEGYSFLSVPAVYERITPFARGTRRVQLPYAPARIKQFDTLVDRAIETLKLIAYIATLGIAALAFLILNALGVVTAYDKLYGQIIVEREGWIAKLIECDDIKKPSGASELRWLLNVKNRYPSRVFNKITTKIPLSTLEFYNLFVNGFLNTLELKWYIISEYAEVTYVEDANISLQSTERFV